MFKNKGLDIVITCNMKIINYLNYRDPTSPNLVTRRKQQRNILWFNPPHSKTVKTKIGKFSL